MLGGFKKKTASTYYYSTYSTSYSINNVGRVLLFSTTQYVRGLLQYRIQHGDSK